MRAPLRLSLRLVPSLALAFTVALASSTSHAFSVSVGATCRLNRDITLDVKTGQGRMRVPLVKGDTLTVLAVTATSSRVESGDFEGRVDNALLEDACSHAVSRCVLKAPIRVSERASGDGKAWRIKPGGTLEVLSRDGAFSSVRIGPVEGFVETVALNEQCPEEASEPVLEDDDDVDDALEDDDEALDEEEDLEGGDAKARPLVLKKPPKGTKVMLLPLLLDGRRDAELATLYEDALTSALVKARGDTVGVSGTRPNARSRALATKQVLVDLVEPARKAGLTHLIVAELGYDDVAPTNGPRTVTFDDDVSLADKKDVLVVTVFDLVEGKVTKRLKVNPSLKFADPWAKRTLDALAPHLPPAEKRADAAKPADGKTASKKP